jgi:nitric oxide reductase activation protein
MKHADQEDQCGVKDDTDERRRSENQKASAESQDRKEQPIENSAVEPHEGGADKVPSSGQKLDCEQDATTAENGDECVISVNTAKSSNGIALPQDLPDNDVDRDATTAEQNIVAKETGEVQVSAHKKHVVMRDSVASEQITDFAIVDTAIAGDTAIKGNNNISENADLTPGGATKGVVGRVMSSPEDGIIES